MLMELHPGTMRSGFESRWLSQNEGQSSTGRARVSSILSSPNCFIVVVVLTSGGSIPQLHDDISPVRRLHHANADSCDCFVAAIAGSTRARAGATGQPLQPSTTPRLLLPLLSSGQRAASSARSHRQAG